MFQPFEQERMMSKWENVVAYNLAESGVHPATVYDLTEDPAVIEELLTMELNYVQANGILELRECFAALYPGATPDHLLVTVGCAEANYITLHTVLEPGDEMVMMLPNYLQVWGIAQNYGVRVKGFHLKPEQGWAPGFAPARGRRLGPDQAHRRLQSQQSYGLCPDGG